MRACPNNKWSHKTGWQRCDCLAGYNATYPSLAGAGHATGQDNVYTHEQIGLTQGPHNPNGGYYRGSTSTAPLPVTTLAVEDMDARRQNRMPREYQVPGVEVQYGMSLYTLGDWYLNECRHGAAGPLPSMPEVYGQQPMTPQGKPFTSVSIQVPNS